MLSTIEKWHKTRQGFLAFAVAEAGLVLLFVTLAIDSGSLIQWTLAAVLLVGVIQNFAKFILTFWKKG